MLAATGRARRVILPRSHLYKEERDNEAQVEERDNEAQVEKRDDEAQLYLARRH
jgi:hypothetical protein